MKVFSVVFLRLENEVGYTLGRDSNSYSNEGGSGHYLKIEQKIQFMCVTSATEMILF